MYGRTKIKSIILNVKNLTVVDDDQFLIDNSKYFKKIKNVQPLYIRQMKNVNFKLQNKTASRQTAAHRLLEMTL